MELRLWRNINKKRNSTYIPDQDPNFIFNVDLKEDTSVITPTFLLDNIALDVNYAYWEGRYYFVDNIRRGITGQYELECTSDYLATFKSYIGAYSTFVERSSYLFDTYVADPILSSKNAIVHANHETLTLNDITSTGCYLLRTVSQVDTDLTKTGITTYVLDETDLKTVLDFMFTDSNFPDILTDMAVKSFFNPFQYITDLRWIPWTKDTLVQGGACGATGPVRFGWFNSKYSCRILTAAVMNQDFTLVPPTCYYANNDFRRYDSRFTQFKLLIFGHGTIDVSPMDVFPGGLRIRRTVDFTTGEMITFVRRSDGTHPIGEFKDMLAIPVQISQVNSNLFGSVSNIAQNVGRSFQAAGVADNPFGVAASAIGGVVTVGTSIVNAIHGEVAAGIQGNGQNGNRAAIIQNPYYILYETAFDSCEFATSRLGRPLNRTVQLSTIPGYIQCAGASIDIPGFAGDKEAVNNALNGGFYYE